MKILAIRGKNLASLEGEFAVDFTSEPLVSAGLFAITGPTGAGKSTLLDALCLALFDKTPRMNRARENGVSLPDVSDKTLSQNDCRSLLRRGTAEGYAEADFQALNGELYRTRWAVRRARGRAEGSLQPSEMRLYNLSTGVEEQGGKGEILRRVTQLLGLSFDQFTRAVLLAQGDFATFLKAPEEEKADLLEKLTGTEIYSRISQLLYQHNKEMQERYNDLSRQLELIPLLTAEERAAFVAEFGACRLAEEESSKRCEVLKGQLRWLDERAGLAARRREADVEHEKARTAYDEATPRREYIGRYDLAQEIRDDYQSLRLCEESRKSEQTRLDALAVESRRCAQDLARKEAQRKDVEQKRLLLRTDWDASAPERLRAAELDTRLAVSHQALTAARKSCEKASADLAAARKMRLDRQSALEQARQDLASIETWQAKNRDYEPLVGHRALIKELLSDYSRLVRERAAEEHMQADNAKLLQNYETELAAQQEENRHLDTIMPSEVYLLRTRLVEGEPCPVCGSPHHYLTAKEAKTLREEELERQKKETSQRIETLTRHVENSRQADVLHRSRIESYRRQETERSQKLDELLHLLVPAWRQEEQLDARLDAYAASWNDKQTARVRLQSLVESLSGELPALDENLKKLESIEKNERQTLDAACRSHEELQVCRRSLLGGKPLSDVEAAHERETRRLDEQWAEENRLYNELNSRAEHLNGTMSQLTRHLSDLQQQSKAGQRRIEEWLDTHRTITASMLSELMSHTPAWVAGEKKSLALLQEQLSASATRCKERAEALLRHETQSDKPSLDDPALLQQQLAEQSSLLRQQSARMAEIQARLDADDKNRQATAHLVEQQAALVPEKQNWERLNELYGSADGQKFRRIAQGYTLDRLLLYANLHLRGLSSRYTLQRVSRSLALQVADNDMLGEIRSVHTLSGGESFLISLALALGLSSLSSYRMNIESLFIDEGFGSLDADTLRTAMEALEHLQIQGRKIGVISHVAEMTERIPVQVQVERVSNGCSRVRVVET